MKQEEFDFIKDAFSQIIDDIAGNPDWNDAASAVSADLGALERELEGNVSSDKSLEEAADTYKNSYSNPNGALARASKRAFIAGWKCRDDQMPMPEDTVLFNKGVAEGRRLEREDMLKDAVEGEAIKIFEEGVASIHYNAFAIGEMAYFCKSDNIHLGQKVRIVVIKEEEG